jgi:hypothetical protein
MTTPASTPAPLTGAATKATFTHITDVVLDTENVTKALKKAGIDEIADILTLDDIGVESLTYPDSDPKVTLVHPLKRGEIGLLRTFIHFDHYHEEIKDPIDNNGLLSPKMNSTRFVVILNTRDDSSHCQTFSTPPLYQVHPHLVHL